MQEKKQNNRYLSFIKAETSDHNIHDDDSKAEHM